MYIGMTCDLRRRLKQHQAGESKATKGRLPWDLIYYEAYRLIEDAAERESFLKSGGGRNF
ncbi:MAG: GIY-YIG nuclease family protein [Verrucomicrobiota bacterium]